jgi:hypothetical protein
MARMEQGEPAVAVEFFQQESAVRVSRPGKVSNKDSPRSGRVAASLHFPTEPTGVPAA